MKERLKRLFIVITAPIWYPCEIILCIFGLVLIPILGGLAGAVEYIWTGKKTIWQAIDRMF